MRIFIINPNSDPQMTAAIERTARTFAQGQFEVVCRGVETAPRFIETHGDQIQEGPGMLALVAANRDQFDAFVVACHSDPNLDALKEATSKPVVGIGEASMKLATMLGCGFSVVTTGLRSVPGKLAQARKYGLERDLISVRAPEAGATYSDDTQMVTALAKRAVQEDLAEVIVLGCAGFTGLDKPVAARIGAPVLDGVVCALIIATGLVAIGVSTSKIRSYHPND